MSRNKTVRRQLFVDAKLQGPLVVRVILYWVVCLISITLMLLCWRILTGPPRQSYQYLDEIWFYCGPALIASFVLLPLVLVDLVRFSNRFVGPFLRLRQAMRALARGEHVAPIEFRRGDFWKEFADEFNAVVCRVQGELPPPEADFHEERDEPAAVVTA